MGLFIVELMIDRLLEISTKTARVFRSFSPFNSSITRSDLNFALKFLLCLDMILNPLFHTDCSISDSLKSVRKSVLIYETIIEPQRYGILNRAVFYVSRLISSQKERDFENTEYDDIKRVYSIWVCMNMEENSLSHIHLVKDDLVGYHDWRGNLDLFNIVMIGLAKELPGQGVQYELHRLLGALFAQGLTAGQRLNIIKEEYDIPIEQNIEQEVDVMCNLSQGIKEAGIAEGRSEGRAEEIIETGYEFGLSEQDILERLQKKLSIPLQKAQEYLLMFGKRTV